MGKLGKKLVDYIADATALKTTGLSLANEELNRPYIKTTIADLDPSQTGSTPNVAMVMSAGPSLHRKEPARLLLEHNFREPVITVDSSMGYCLRNGLVPNYVVVVDPHHSRTVRWFGDTALEQREDDEYFQRQELDPIMHQDGLSYNRDLIELVNKHGSNIKAIISTSAHPEVTQRCLESGMELYWWNPMFDDYEKPDSLARRIYELNGVPCMVTGANVGTSAYVFAAGVIKAKNVAMTGMDFGYPPGNPLINTQYYTELIKLFGDRYEDAYIDVYNPHLREWWYTDPTYYWFRQGLLELAEIAPCITYNCTEGGIIFGKDIKTMKLERFLKRLQRGLPNQ